MVLLLTILVLLSLLLILLLMLLGRISCSSLSRAFLTLSLSSGTLLFDKAGLGHFSIASAVLAIAHDQLHHVFQLKRVTVDCRLHILLLFGTLDNLFLHGVASDDSVDCHGFGLADSVRAVRSLLIHSRIPVVVVEDDRVCGDQIDAEAASTGTEQESKDVVVALILFHHVPSVLDCGLTVHAEKGHLFPSQEVL